eukprot:COSAG06_NODE_46488_length_346_cov_1.113360_1_plen_35_part_10
MGTTVRTTAQRPSTAQRSAVVKDYKVHQKRLSCQF